MRPSSNNNSSRPTTPIPVQTQSSAATQAQTPRSPNRSNAPNFDKKRSLEGFLLELIQLALARKEIALVEPTLSGDEIKKAANNAASILVTAGRLFNDIYNNTVGAQLITQEMPDYKLLQTLSSDREQSLSMKAEYLWKLYEAVTKNLTNRLLKNIQLASILEQCRNAADQHGLINLKSSRWVMAVKVSEIRTKKYLTSLSSSTISISSNTPADRAFTALKQRIALMHKEAGSAAEDINSLEIDLLTHNQRLLEDPQQQHIEDSQRGCLTKLALEIADLLSWFFLERKAPTFPECNPDEKTILSSLQLNYRAEQTPFLEDLKNYLNKPANQLRPLFKQIQDKSPLLMAFLTKDPLALMMAAYLNILTGSREEKDRKMATVFAQTSTESNLTPLRQAATKLSNYETTPEGAEALVFFSKLTSLRDILFPEFKTDAAFTTPVRSNSAALFSTNGDDQVERDPSTSPRPTAVPGERTYQRPATPPPFAAARSFTAQLGATRRTATPPPSSNLINSSSAVRR